MGVDERGEPRISNQDPSESFQVIFEKLIKEEIEKELNEKTAQQEKMELEKNSEIGKLCYFDTYGVVVRNGCHNASYTTETSSYLNLAIPNTTYKDLYRLITYFEKEEQLSDEGGNTYNCEKCHSYQNASKHLVLSKMPEVLCINIKRYRTAKLNGILYQRGIYDKVVCPETIKIRQYKYKLRSWMCGGGLRVGHIVMYGYADDGTLYKADDRNVIPINDNSTKDKAQFLVYELEE